MKYLINLIFGLILIGCRQAREAPASNDVAPRLNTDVQKYISKTILYDSVAVTDSLVLSSLNATLYRARLKNVFDAPLYTIIRDHLSDSLYSIILPGWPGGLDPSCNTQLEILGGGGEPTHEFLKGLEDFINQRNRSEFDQTMDSVILFWWPRLMRVYDEAIINNAIVASLNSVNISTPNAWLNKTQSLIHEKLSDQNAHFFSGPLYIELRIREAEQDKKYEILSFRIGFQGCPDSSRK